MALAHWWRAFVPLVPGRDTSTRHQLHVALDGGQEAPECTRLPPDSVSSVGFPGAAPSCSRWALLGLTDGDLLAQILLLLRHTSSSCSSDWQRRLFGMSSMWFGFALLGVFWRGERGNIVKDVLNE
jgi:hypothetical protein